MRVPRLIQRFRYSHLLAVVLLLLTLPPFIEEGGLIDVALTEVLLPVMFVLCILSCARTRIQLVLGIGLLLAMQVMRLAAQASGISLLESVYPLLAFSFLVYISSIILRKIFVDTDEVDIDTILGSIVVYLLIGIAWAFLYVMIEVAVPGSFTIGEAAEITFEGTFDRFIGFSFITLTTLGYGNIVPVTGRADVFAYMEAIVGQIYMTVLVARLVAMHLAHQQAQRHRDE